MRMRAEPLSRRHDVIVENTQRTKVHPRRVMVLTKAERVMGIEPSEIKVATLAGQHVATNR